MAKTCQIIAVLLMCFLLTRTASAIELLFPVECEIMTNCWITNHVDLNNDAGRIEDYMCGSKATDNNKSTHISLTNLNSTKENVPVVAAASGTVTIAEDVGGFCGGRVLIDHGNGWETSYCHLNSDTILVKQGDAIPIGQTLGFIGMSGQTEWPHLSFAVLRNGMVFDPFSGRTSLEGCSRTSAPLWAGGINPFYDPSQITSVGFTVGQVTNNDIMAGSIPSATRIDTNTPQLSLWAMLMNVQHGDTIEMVIHTPSGRVLNQQTVTAEKDQEYFPIDFVTRRKGFIWNAGEYQGTIKITRNVNGNHITVGKTTTVEFIQTEN